MARTPKKAAPSPKKGKADKASTPAQTAATLDVQAPVVATAASPAAALPEVPAVAAAAPVTGELQETNAATTADAVAGTENSAAVVAPAAPPVVVPEVKNSGKKKVKDHGGEDGFPRMVRITNNTSQTLYFSGIRAEVPSHGFTDALIQNESLLKRAKTDANTIEALNGFVDGIVFSEIE